VSPGNARYDFYQHLAYTGIATAQGAGGRPTIEKLKEF
jgi:hypothetical protein